MAFTPRRPAPKDHVLLGVIGAAHGIKGEVSITSYTADPGDIAAYGALTDGQQKFVIESVRVTPKTVLAVVAGVRDRTAAERLRNVPLYVPRARLPDTAAEGSYYYEDLKGLAVVDPTGASLGRVIEVVNFGAGDLLEVQFGNAKDTEYFAFTDAVVPNVDLAKGTLTLVRPPETGGDEREPE